MGQKRKDLTPERSPQHRWGAELRALRDGKGFSLAELGDLANFDRSYLARLERGDQFPSENAAKACDRVLGAGGELIRSREAADRERRKGNTHVASKGDHEANRGLGLAFLPADHALSEMDHDGVTVPCRTADGTITWVNVQEILDVSRRDRAFDSAKEKFAVLGNQRYAAAIPATGYEDMASDLNRRELLRLLAITAPALAMVWGEDVDTERLAARTSDCSPALLAEYATVNARLWQVYAQATPKRAALPLVNEHLAVITSRLRDAHGTARKELCALASDLFQLSGEIFFDQNRYTDAAHCYTLAADAAREGGSADLWSCAMTRHSFIYVYGGEFPGAVPMLEAATGIARKGDRSLSTWQWASCVNAQALAGLGDLPGSQRALDDAETVITLPGPVHNDGWLRFDGSRLAEERGNCYTMLGRPDLATASLEAALAGDLSPRRRGSVHTDLAATGLQRRELDQFAAHAEAALRLAGETESGYVTRRLKGLRPQLGAFADDQRVRDITDKIASLEVAQ